MRTSTPEDICDNVRLLVADTEQLVSSIKYDTYTHTHLHTHTHAHTHTHTHLLSLIFAHLLDRSLSVRPPTVLACADLLHQRCGALNRVNADGVSTTASLVTANV